MQKLPTLLPDLWPAHSPFQYYLSTPYGIVLFLGRFVSTVDLEALWKRRTQLFKELKYVFMFGSFKNEVGELRNVDPILSLLCTDSGIRSLKNRNCKIDELFKLDYINLKI